MEWCNRKAVVIPQRQKRQLLRTYPLLASLRLPAPQSLQAPYSHFTGEKFLAQRGKDPGKQKSNFTLS
jgi:hypothetical protein